MPCRLSGRARQCIELTDRFRKLVAYVQELLRSHNLLAFDRSLHRRERITWHLSDNLGDVVCNYWPMQLYFGKFGFGDCAIRFLKVGY